MVRKYRCNNIITIPNGVDIPCKRLRSERKDFKPTIGFLYYWGVQNSIDDIDWFIKTYVPILKKEFPHLHVVAAGKGATSSALEYFQENRISRLYSDLHF